jgi:hypothetical protein
MAVQSHADRVVTECPGPRRAGKGTPPGGGALRALACAGVGRAASRTDPEGDQGVARLSDGRQMSLFAEPAPERPEPQGARVAPRTAQAAVVATRTPRSGRSRVCHPTEDAAELPLRRGLPLTVPAPNWEAWVQRPLRIEIESRHGRASLPMVMILQEAESLCPIPHGTFAPEEFDRDLHWMPQEDAAHGTVLVARGCFWIGGGGRDGHVETRPLPGVRLRVADEDGFGRRGPCPQTAAAIARRLDAASQEGGRRRFLEDVRIAEEDVDRLLAALAGARVVLGTEFGRPFPDSHHWIRFTSRPFPVTAGRCAAGRIRLDGPAGIFCETAYDAIHSVRINEGVTGDELLIDLWRAEDGYGASWRLHFADIPSTPER